MQFINNGPEIPDELLQAHEEGRVVFFCGAGISYPAGLPGFKGLVQEIYRLCGTNFSEIERASFDRDLFDATLDQLEHRFPGNRLAVRKNLVKVLKPKLRREGATKTHEALLQLARTHSGDLRLVTTNFDRVFHTAAKRIKKPFQTHAAPMLPIPKNSKWNGLVYLHGVLPEKTDDTALNRLVMTSGDFGLAYLIERWAARFVSELFRNYVVCFVGYSINDPVLRYMMDALAADRLLGEVTPQAWAFGDCITGEEHRKTVEWKAKGVTPILYNVSTDGRDHSLLHKTLYTWAETYRDGVLGKTAIIVRHALARPSGSTQQDDFIGRMLWALSDKSGLPAKNFAELNPVPSLDWLDAFSKNQFKHNDLIRFQVPAHNKVDEELYFSLTHRPAPYDLAPRMALVSAGTDFCRWDDVMSHLSRWLVRHLGDPKLIIWVAEQGGKIHANWHWWIEHQLNDLAKKEKEGKTVELDEIRSQAQNAIPNTKMRTLWRILLSGRVKSRWQDSDLHSWGDRLKIDGLNCTSRLELRKLLSPQIEFKKPFRFSDETENMVERVDWELVLQTNHVSSTIKGFTDENWISAQPLLLDDFQSLLCDALDLQHELGGADELSDRSHWSLPSITPHWQNRGFHDWVSLIELLRDAWLVLLEKDNSRAKRIAHDWFDIPYPTFKRLALFAASKDGCVFSEQWVEWLLANDTWWLWASDTGREMFRLLVLQGLNLTNPAQQRLEQAILFGPPRKMYRDDLEHERWENLVARSVWLRLAKLKTAGVVLGVDAQARFDELSNSFPEWKLKPHERDEFSQWMTGTGDPDHEENQYVDIAPKTRHELVEWLVRASPHEQQIHADTWRDVCRTSFLPSRLALRDLANNGVWPVERWRQALQAWGGESMVLRSWLFAAPLMQKMPDEIFAEIVHNVAWWIEETSKTINRHENISLDLCKRILELPLEVGSESYTVRGGIRIYNPVSSAINHPVGHITQALINLWFKRKPNDNDLLPIDIKILFTELCDTKIEKFRHARTLLCSQLISFYRVDPEWTKQYLLPLFSWDDPIEAVAAWAGFLWSPRVYRPLLVVLKQYFLDTLNHYAELGEQKQQFANFLTYFSLGSIEGYTSEELRTAFSLLPQDGLERAAQTLYQALEGASDQREDYWENRIKPFWIKIWPKNIDLVTPKISDSMSRLVIAAGDKFPDALDQVKAWLVPLEYPDYVVHLLKASGMCKHYPIETLNFLNSIVRVDLQSRTSDLISCLEIIRDVSPDLEQDTSYRRLLLKA